MRTTLAVAAITVALFCTAAHAQGCGYGPPPQPMQTADVYLHSVYDQYATAPNKGIELNEAAYRKYFEADLAAMIMKDDALAQQNNDIPTLDGDPFIDSQDWEVTNLTIKVDHETADRADATIRFRNQGEAKVLHVQLVRAGREWKIHDIVWNGTEGTLRGIYRHPN